ncbi:uncharacterized protein PHALS_04298 [Plasmopara halstedii]|uniref:Uncharacterized protein n=1 Tax=Plasmopara halstedii TaxID=4781 RepID=A0A0P1B1W9_PLAHL|nr:uncharacterized protein PHALS_04298 [Plasmopara halstedii]CEG47423.1 hypothetical protein PHALS_04298 [Plasmopara halstedii]|eukprot:XP_024583792.1 hypothetical protein PHALS_04298 [Plasmopara halstedii]
MELRNRATGISKPGQRGVDVALGPTIYNGERYSKMSERLKRQQKNPSDIADINSRRIMRLQIIAFVVALVFVFTLVSTMMYQAHIRRSGRKPLSI